jgi:hypothetical protein
MAQPLGKRPDVAGQTRRLCLDLACQLQLGGKRVVRIMPAGAVDLVLQLLAPRSGTLGQARQRVGESFVLVLDVKYIAMARRLTPRGLLPGAQALPRVGNRIVGFQPLAAGVQ